MRHDLESLTYGATFNGFLIPGSTSTYLHCKRCDGYWRQIPDGRCPGGEGNHPPVDFHDQALVRAESEHNTVSECANGSPLSEYRKDGWPLCPCCGEDELYSLLNTIPYVQEHHHNPPIQDYLDAGLRCYYCNWTSQPDVLARKRE